jgi:hypothetical protein
MNHATEKKTSTQSEQITLKVIVYASKNTEKQFISRSKPSLNVHPNLRAIVPTRSNCKPCQPNYSQCCKAVDNQLPLYTLIEHCMQSRPGL